MRFEELIPPDDRIILVDSGAVQFQDDEGTKGINILTDIECTHDRVCMYIYISRVYRTEIYVHAHAPSHADTHGHTYTVPSICN